MDLQNITLWVCWGLFIIGILVIWINFWIGVFYTTFGFTVLYLLLRMYFKNYYIMAGKRDEKTHGVM